MYTTIVSSKFFKNCAQTGVNPCVQFLKKGWELLQQYILDNLCFSYDLKISPLYHSFKPFHWKDLSLSQISPFMTHSSDSVWPISTA